MTKLSLLTIFVISIAARANEAGQPLLLQQPTLSRTQIVFACAGDLWIAGREGGEAKRLTAGVGVESTPYFSPDGSLVAFTGEYDGNLDVYLVPAAGGVPRRLTYHPDPDRVAGWTPDGKSVLFRSPRTRHIRVVRLFTLPVDGVFPAELPLPMAEEGAFSPDGSRLAYVPLGRQIVTWKRYRGGRTMPIWIARLSDSAIEKVPRENSNDFSPMWIGSDVYFLSDRNGPVALFRHDTKTKKVTQALANAGLDFKNASAGPDAIIIEQFGSLLLYDLKSGKARKLDIRVSGDMPEVRPRLEKVDRRIAGGRLSPTGARAVFEARGEILTVPAEKGDVRNLTNTVAAAERDPSWSPDGKRIAYLSDESGEYLLHVRNQDGMGEPQKFKLSEPPGFYYGPLWSPDSKKIAYTDKRLNAWYLDVEKGAPTKIDTDIFDGPRRVSTVGWSPDSRWLAYTRQLRNSIRAIFVYSLETGARHQITDGMSDASHPVFDKDGKHLYFSASTDFGLTVGWRDMSSFNRPVTRSVYAVVLRKDLPSPLAPESDEEKAEPPKPPAEMEKPKEKEALVVKIDPDNISQRILALPIPARNYGWMVAGKAGVLFLIDSPFTQEPGSGGGGVLFKFDLKTRKTDRVLDGVRAWDVSANGEKLLYRRGDAWAIASTGAPVKPGEGTLKLDGMEVRVEPRAEWRQMFREAWRQQRDFFYDPGHHGLDLEAAEKRYEPFLEGVSSRGDLSYLFMEMMSELTVSHLTIGGGSQPDVKRVRGGLLGADYKIENGRYRFAHVFNGESWNPQLRAPLTQPGVNVVAGEYLLAVNGRDLRSTDNLYSFFEATAGKSVLLRVGPNPATDGSREVTVIPVDNESGLRYLAWIEENRRKVDQMSGGRLAYVHLPDTAFGGYVNFNRYYFAQTDKEGAVIDERFNGGGAQADYIIDYMRRPLMAFRVTRDGEDFKAPLGAIFGPKAMLINEYAGSGGDVMPFYFRKAGIGPLIGKTTWGGLVGGLGGQPPLMDGGFVASPATGFYNPGGSWEVENFGVKPDIEVELDPAAVRTGRDPQLEKAVEVLLTELKKNPPPKYRRPPFPNYHSGPARPSQ